MCSTAGLPPTGVCLAFRVTRVDPPRPGSVLVRLWGRFQQRERQPEYQRVHSEIQNWAKAARLGGGGGGGGAGRSVPFPPLETNERCLVEMSGEWHRARVLSRVGDDYTVFTLDEGRALPARARSLDRGTIKTIVVGNFEDTVPSGPDEGIPTTLACMDQYSLSNQIEDADLNESQGTLKVSEHLQGSVQTIDLYEEIFNSQHDQPFTEEIGDDSMTRILISHDDDYFEDQNLSEAQVNSSETEEQFETVTTATLNICLEEGENKILPCATTLRDVMNKGLQIADAEKEESIPSKDPLTVTINTGMEKGSPLLILQADNDVTCVEVQSENEHQGSGSSYPNPSTDVSQKEVIGSEVLCEKEDGQMLHSHVATTAAVHSVELDKEQLIHGASIKVTDAVLPSTKSEVALFKHFIDQNQKHQLMPFATLPASEKLSKFENLSDKNVETNSCITVEGTSTAESVDSLQ